MKSVEQGRRAAEWARGALAAERDRGDEGYINPLWLLRAAQLGKRVVSACRPTMGVAAGLTASLIVAGGAALSDGPKGHADIASAETEATIAPVLFDTQRRISVARLYFKEELSAQGIVYKVPRKMHPDFNYTGNLQLEGTGVTAFEVPYAAITQQPNAATGKMDLVVAGGHVVIRTNWVGAGPEVLPYTLDDGAKNFSDTQGFKESILGGVAAAERIGNVDGLANRIDRLRRDTAHDMRQKGLDVFDEECVPQLGGVLREEIADTLREELVRLGQSDRVGEISIAGTLAWQKDPAEKIVAGTEAKKSGYYYRFGNFSVDAIRCNLDQLEAAS